eukprot:138608-Chlamydomonas_euryale.AAC.1
MGTCMLLRPHERGFTHLHVTTTCKLPQLGGRGFTHPRPAVSAGCPKCGGRAEDNGVASWIIFSRAQV